MPLKTIRTQAGRLYRYFERRREGRYAREARGGQPLTVTEVGSILGELGVGAGDHVLVHSHSAILGKVEGGLLGIIRLLQEKVTDAGTVMMPSFPFRGAFWDYAKLDPVFDVRRTPSRMGLITEVFRRLPDVERSLHPTHPISIWGRNAKVWSRGHETDSVPFHRDSPFGRLHEVGGKVLFMDLDGRHLTQLHVVPPLMGISSFPCPIYIHPPRSMRAVDWSGTPCEIPVLLHNPRLTSRIDARYFYPDMERLGIVRRRKLRGYIPFVVVDARRMAEFFVELAERGVTYCDKTSLTARLRSFLVGFSTDAPRPARVTGGPKSSG